MSYGLRDDSLGIEAVPWTYLTHFNLKAFNILSTSTSLWKADASLDRSFSNSASSMVGGDGERFPFEAFEDGPAAALFDDVDVDIE